MRRKGKVFRPIAIPFFQNFALTLFLLVSVLLIPGCKKQEEQIARAPTPTPTPQCTAIDPRPFINQGTTTSLGTHEACVPVGQCTGTQIDTEKKIAQDYCESTENATCRPGAGCSGNRSCKAVYDAANSSSVHIRSCVAGAAGPPGCPAGEQLCKCNLFVTGRGKLDCDCGCR